MLTRSGWAGVLALAFLTLLCASSPVCARTLVVGTIQDKMPAVEIGDALPFVRHLASLLRSEGVTEGKVLVARSTQQMADYIREGKVDVFIGSSYPAAVAADLAGVKYLLRRWKDGKSEYRSLIFTSTASGVKSLRHLKGKLIAFEERYSTSGYLLPKLSLHQAGLTVRELPHVDKPTPPGLASYLFSEDDETTMVWVLAGKVAAGAMDDNHFALYARKDGSKLAVLHTSPVYPRQVVCYRANLPTSLVAKLKQALLCIHLSVEGRKALDKFDDTTKFDELTSESIASLRQLQKMLRTADRAGSQ